MNLKGKVIFLNNRVWTIYSESTTGVYCYEGVDSQKFSSDKSNLSYFEFNEIEDSFLQNQDISWYMQKMKQEERKPLTKSHASLFLSYLTGYPRSSVMKRIEEKESKDHNLNYYFLFKPGAIHYQVGKSGKYLVLSHNLNGNIEHAYYDYLTFESVFNNKPYVGKADIKDE